MSDAEGSSELSAAANSSWMEPALFDAHPHPPSAQSLHTHPARVCHNAFAALWCFCFLAGKVSSDKPGLRSGFSCPDTHTAGLELPGRARCRHSSGVTPGAPAGGGGGGSEDASALSRHSAAAQGEPEPSSRHHHHSRGTTRVSPGMRPRSGMENLAGPCLPRTEPGSPGGARPL